MKALAPRITPIRITVLPPEDERCQANECPLPATHVLVYLHEDWSRWESRGVCLGHGEALREHRGFALMPVRLWPGPDRMGAYINAEIQRRMQARQQSQMFQAFQHMTGTATYTFTVGGQQGWMRW